MTLWQIAGEGVEINVRRGGRGRVETGGQVGGLGQPAAQQMREVGRSVQRVSQCKKTTRPNTPKSLCRIILRLKTDKCFQLAREHML